MKSCEFALKAYDLARRPMANSVLLGSAKSGKMYEFESELGDSYEVLGPAINKQWAWIDETSPEDVAEHAKMLFAEML